MAENSLIAFLKKSEYLFTILGVFLILAFIFNNIQLTNIADSQYQSTNITINQFQCSINGTEIPILNITNLVTPINCTGNIVTNLQSGVSSDPFIHTSKTFSFICLLLAFLIYLAICYDLIITIKNISGRIFENFSASSSREIIQECAILIITPFILEGASWFFVLLNNNYPTDMPDAFVSIMLMAGLIEFIVITAFFYEVNRAIIHRTGRTKRRTKVTLILAIVSIIFGILALLFTILQLQKSDYRIILFSGIFGIMFISFGLNWIFHLIKNRNLPIEVSEID